MTNKMECNVCGSDFDLNDEGGTSGYFGAIPVNFCPWCLSCMIDMVQQMTSEEIEHERE